MDTLDTIVKSTPTYQPYRVVIVFAGVPVLGFLLVLAVYSYFGKTYDEKRNVPIPYSKRFRRNLPLLVFKYSPWIGIACILWAAIIMIVQACFIYNHLGLATELDYYLKIDIPEYEAVDLINLAGDSYSLYAYLKGSSVQRKLTITGKKEDSGFPRGGPEDLTFQQDIRLNAMMDRIFSTKVKKHSSPSAHSSQASEALMKQFMGTSSLFKYIKFDENSFNFISTPLEEKARRRLSSTTSLALVYHLGSWDNILLENNLVSACRTERNILKNVQCINLQDGTSLLGSVFNEDTCQFTVSYQEALETITLSDNSDYVEDNVDPSNPVSAVIGSLFKVGSCDDMSTDSFESQLSAQSVGDVETVYISSTFITKAFEDAIYNGVYVSAIALIFGSIYIFLSVQGLLATIMTLYSILVSVVNAAAVLIDFEYGTFSAFNVLSVFILIGVGGNAVVMFGAAWREVVPRGATPTVIHFIHVYNKISRPICFTVCAAAISLFSKLISPVIVISQLGAFMGVSVLVFYLCYHIIIIPVWITTGWFHFPKSYHDAIDQHINYLTCQKNDDGEEQQQLITDEEHAYDPILERPSAFNPAVIDPSSNPEPNSSNVVLDSQGNPVYVIPSTAVVELDSDDEEYYHEEGEAGNPANNTGEEAQRGQNREQRRKNKLKYTRPTLLRQIADFLTKKEANDLNNFTQNSAPTGDRFYSPIVQEAPGGNYIQENSSAHGMTSSIDGTNIIRYPVTTITPTAPSTSNVVTIERKKKLKEKFVVKGFSCCIFIITLLGLLLIAYLMVIKYELDLGIPQLFPEDSNMGQVLYIVKNYKPSLLSSIDSAGSVTVITTDPTFQPTLAPTDRFTPRPTFNPTATPTIFSTPPPTIYVTNPPTFTAAPTISPTLYPTSFYTSAPKNNTYTDYTINTCWGLSSSKRYKDSDVNVTYDGQIFSSYVNHGLIDDLENFCIYINNNRKSLNINPSWNMESDCIYNQYIETYYSIPPFYRNVTNALLYWASLSTTSSKLLGVEDSDTPTIDPAIPSVRITWLCANFSARTYVSSLIDNPDLAEDIQNRWEDAIGTYGSQYAAQYGVEVIVSSDEFSFPLLAKEVLLSIILAILISTIGFFGLLVWFSWADIFLILLGTLGMIAIFAIAICCHLYIFSATVDLLDVVVLIAIIGIVVDLPIHYILHYMMERDRRRHLKRRWRRKQRLLTNPNNQDQSQAESEIEDEDEDNEDEITLYEQERQLSLNPALHDTNQYMRFSLLHLLVLTLICGIPLLFATFVLLQKTGQYIVIIAVVSYLFSIFILPYLLAFGFRTNITKWFYEKCLKKGTSYHVTHQRSIAEREAVAPLMNSNIEDDINSVTTAVPAYPQIYHQNEKNEFAQNPYVD